MIKVFYRCVDSNLSWWTVGKEYPLIDGRIQCDDPDIGPTERRIADLCCEEMKASGAAIELTRIERETFEAAGLQWFRHTPGDPMPCDGRSLVEILIDDETGHDIADKFSWDDCGPLSIIGWRYSDAETSAPEPKLTLQKAEGEIWIGEPTTAYIAEPLSQSEFRRLYFGDFTPPTPILGQADGFVDHGPEEFTKPAPIERRYGRDANTEMQQADLAAMDDPGHLTPNQRRHIDAMEEKQAAKEKIQRDAEADRQREHSQALTDAANAMERVKQDHGHRLGYLS